MPFDAITYGVLKNSIKDNVFLTPKDLGAIPNDSNTAVATKNLEIIYQASLLGTVLIDDVYYIGGSTRYTLIQNFVLLGKPNAEIRILANCNPFIIGGNIDLIKINGIKINTLASARIIFDGNASVSNYVSNFECSDCEFDGNLRLFEWNAGITTNPAVVNYGVGEFRLQRNKISNILATFIKANDLPSDKVIIEDNHIRNFAYTIFYSGIENTHSFRNEMFAAKKLLITRNNYVCNDDDFFGNTSDLYHTFVLFEGMRHEYTKNTVRKLKVNGAAVAVYDQYSSCDDILIYEDNVWENNLCIHSGVANNELIKAKASKNITCRNNVFKVDPTYITSIGGNLNYAWCYFHGRENICETFIFENNLIDVYDFRPQTSGNLMKNVVIRNNTIRAELAGAGGLVYYSIQNSDIYANATIDVIDNLIEIRNNVTNNFYLVRCSDLSSGVYKPKEITVKGNAYNGGWGYLTYNTLAKNITILNNMFKGEYVTASTSRDGLYYSDNIATGKYCDKLISSGNVLSSTKRIQQHPNMLYGGCNIMIDDKHYGKFLAQQLSLVAYDPTVARKHITYKCSYQEADNKKDFEIRAIYGYDVGEDRNYLKFPSTDGTMKTIYLNRLTGGDTYVTGDNTAIYVYNTGASSNNKPTAIIDVSVSANYITINGLPTQDDLCYFETNIVIMEGSDMNLPIPDAVVTYDPPSLADAEGVTTTVALTGATLGDLVVASFNKDLVGVTLSAYVSSANTVSVRFQNESGGVVNLDNGTLKVKLIKI